LPLDESELDPLFSVEAEPLLELSFLLSELDVSADPLLPEEPPFDDDFLA
jgi:hypothetical protein